MALGHRDLVVTGLSQQRENVDAVKSQRPAPGLVLAFPVGEIVPEMVSEKIPAKIQRVFLRRLPAVSQQLPAPGRVSKIITDAKVLSGRIERRQQLA